MYISVKNLTKTFKIQVKEKGLLNSFKAFFKPEYKLVRAVDNISFDIEKGEIVRIHWPKWCWKKHNN